MSAVEQFNDIEKSRDESTNLLFDAAAQFIGSLDQWADHCSPAHSTADAAYCQHQKRMTLAFLYRLFSDRVADTALITR